MTPWTAALQAPLSMGILQAKRLEWVTIPSPPGDLPNQGIESKSLALQANSLLPKPPGKPSKKLEECVKCCCFCLVLSPKSCLTLCDPMELCSLPGSSVHGDSPGKNTGVGCHALLQGVFPTQGLNPGLPYYRKILYRLSHSEAQVYWNG